jgi:uncharacterized protein with NAD-binding domain and iron-sulfur cluster
MKKVAILGGGVGGLSAAHELVERGFEVEVYEAKKWWGGKARSIEKENSAVAGNQNLPGEHGFRFFPAFYKHVPDTMKRIPFPGKPNGVFDNLVGTTEVGIFRKDANKVVLPARYPTSMAEWRSSLYILLHAQFHVPDDEILFFVDKLLVILTSCPERRLAEYEKIDWWSFIEAARHSDAYKKVFGLGLTRSLVALKAEVASTRTVGDILLQLILYMFVLDTNNDRVLNAPTDEAWINPWIKHLTEQGVKLHPNSPTVGLVSDGTKILSARVKIDGAAEHDVFADCFICAFPVEVMKALLTGDTSRVDLHEVSDLKRAADVKRAADLKHAAPSLAGVAYLGTEWMNGIQFYLRREVDVVKGHAIYLDSAWALTSISQRQFWTNADFARYGNGEVKDILSVDISNWTTKGTETIKDRTAEDCTLEEIRNEVWAQLKAHLNKGDEILLNDADLVDWHLDPDIHVDDGKLVNAEPLLVNTVDSWRHRPTAEMKEISNLFLAADYVQTYTDLATMEGANEAARRAVNAIIDQTDSTAPRCKLWPLEEPAMFAPLRDYDQIRFRLGMPHERRGWSTISLAGGYYWGTTLSGTIATRFLQVSWRIGGAITRPMLRAGGLGYSAGSNLAGAVGSLVRAITRKPPS